MENIQRFIFATTQNFKRVSQISNIFEKESLINKKLHLKKEYSVWILSLKERMHKCQFRKVISDIELNYQKYETLSSDIWECRVLKGQCILKIIHRKLHKYPLEIKKDQSKQRYNILFWFNQVFLILEQLVLTFRPELNKDINMEEESTLDKIELVVQLHLDTLYHLALFSLSINEVIQTCSYFAMANNLQIFLDYSRHPRTMHIYQKICLLRASILIGNYDFENSLKYQKQCMDICFRELFCMIDFDEGLENVSKMNKVQKKILSTNFTHLVLAFYLRGVCFEYFGKLNKAIEAYKQSRYFSVKFLNEAEPEFTLFCQRLEKRTFVYFDIIENLKKRVEKIKQRKMREELKKLQKETNSFIGYASKQNNELLKKIANGEKTRGFANLEKTLDKFNFNEDIQEFELKKDKEYPKTKFIMSTVRMIDTLLSKDFIDVVKDMKKIEINNFDNDTLTRIRKRKKEIDNGQIRIVLKNRSRSSECSSSNLDKSASFSHNIKPLVNSKNGKSLSIVPSLRYQPKVVEKLPFDEESFSKSYIKRKSYLEKYSKREISFLKKLLESKKNEGNREKIDSPDPKKIKQDAENEFSIQFNIAKRKDNRTNFQKLIRRKSYTNLEKDLFNKTSMINARKAANVTTSSIHNSIFGNKRDSYIDLSDLDNVSKINNDMIKKLNYEYEQLASRSKSLTQKRNGRKVLYAKTRKSS